MHYYGSETRLTDDLERQLIRDAILEEMEFKPVQALKNLFARFAGLLHAGKSDAAQVPSNAHTVG